MPAKRCKIYDLLNLGINLSHLLNATFRLIWRFPGIGVPLVIIHFSRMFPYKPTILGIPYFMETLWLSGSGLGVSMVQSTSL